MSLKHISLTLCLLLLCAACNRNTANTVTPTPENPAVSTAPSTSTPTVIPTTPTPSPPPTPVIPDIAIADQVLNDEGQLTAASVISTQPGWLVIYAQQKADLGAVLGYTAVKSGINPNITVTINPLSATPTLVAILHIDAGNPGEFEYPNGPDVPLEFESGLIAQAFVPELQLSLPVVDVVNQEILEDGLVSVASVIATEPGWLVIQADDGGQPGMYLGAAPLKAGLNEDLTVHIPWRQGTTTLHALIYTDNGRAHQLDFSGEDAPFLANGSPVIGSFSVTYPPDLFVMDQPVTDGKITVERATSRGPGWLVVYFDDEGEPGLIIGFAPLVDGVNEYVTVDILKTAVTNPLHIRLHEDTEIGDTFDFPRVDPPIIYQGRQVLPYSFNTEPGNYLIVRDQTPDSTQDNVLQIRVPYVVVDSPAWVAIQADINGQPGDILGVTSLTTGINRNVLVEISGGQETERLHAALYADAGEVGQFEYPNGADTPIQRNRRLLSVPFRLLGNWQQ